MLALAGGAWARNAPDFTLSDSDGRAVTLSSYRGKYVLLELMMTTCPHCQAAGKVLEKMQREYPEQLQVLAISTGPQGVVGVSDYRRDFGVTYPVLQGNMNTASGMKVLMDWLGISPMNPNFHVPVFFLISPSGEILQERNPEHESDKDFYVNADKNLETMIREAIPKKAAKHPARKAPSAKKANPATTSER